MFNVDLLQIASPQTVSFMGLKQYKKSSQRRARDSNPRTCNSQQFSRLPQSTTLPALRGKSKGSNFEQQKIINSFINFLSINGALSILVR